MHTVSVFKNAVEYTLCNELFNEHTIYHFIQSWNLTKFSQNNDSFCSAKIVRFRKMHKNSG